MPTLIRGPDLLAVCADTRVGVDEEEVDVAATQAALVPALTVPAPVPPCECSTQLQATHAGERRR